MYRFVCLVFIVLIIAVVEHSAGVKWIPYNTGDKLPENAVLILDSKDRYVGRSRHFDVILPAEIDANGTAKVTSCRKEILKHHFEVLTVNESCRWVTHSGYSDISENIVQGGTDVGGEPIYIGQSSESSSPNSIHILSISLKKQSTQFWALHDEYYAIQRHLSCDTHHKWFDSSAMTLPNKTVSGGKSADGEYIFVARLKHGCEIVTGYVTPKRGIAIGFLSNGQRFESKYCQVLIGELDEYTWKAFTDGEIPDNAVVQGKSGTELEYIARWNNTIGHLSQSKAVQIINYEILVKNEV